MWFEFSQNNSGGNFNGPETVYVEATSADHANDIAESHGIYFDGCDSGLDCSCCGDRWYRQWSDDGEDEPAHSIDITAEELADKLASTGWGFMFRTHYRWVPLDGGVVDVKITPEIADKAETAERESRRSMYGFVFGSHWSTPGSVIKITEPQDADYSPEAGEFNFAPSGCVSWWDESGNRNIDVRNGEPGIVTTKAFDNTMVYVSAETKAELEPVRKQMQKVLTAARAAARKEIEKQKDLDLPPEIFAAIVEGFLA